MLPPFRQSRSAVLCIMKFKSGWFDLQNIKRHQCSKRVPVVSFLREHNLIKIAEEKMSRLFTLYEEIIGLKDVRIAQDKVNEASDRFAVYQETRREAFAALNEVQYKIKQIYAELEMTKRGEDRYVQLISLENKLLKEENFLQVKFKDAEKAEREQFTILTTAVKNSQDREKVHFTKTKYWSVIGSIIGAMLGIIGTSVNNDIKFKKLKNLVQESTREEFQGYVTQYVETAQKLATDFLCLTNTITNSMKNCDSASLEETVAHLNATLLYTEEENRKIKLVLLTASLLFILVPLFSYFSR